MRLLSGSTEAAVLDNGARHLVITAPFFAALGVLLNLRYALQGVGLLLPVVSSVIEMVGRWFSPWR